MSAKVFLLLLALQCLAINLSHEVRDWFIFEGSSILVLFIIDCFGIVWKHDYVNN